MRENKFEAWCAEKEKMYLVMSLTRAEQTPLTLVRETLESETEALPTDSLAFRQFTGILDEHDKEIYEEDIYLLDGVVYRIVWMKYCSAFCLGAVFLPKDKPSGSMYLPLHNKGKGEVIGNSLQNPELLKNS